jgi:DNA-directed RNA polymerase I, II, and III subunit RPABC1
VTIDQVAGSTHRSLVATAAANGSKLHPFTLAELQFNITRHSLVPTHRVLTDAEVGDLMRRLRLPSKFALPVILSSDPVARYLGLETGSVVCVTRPSDSVGQGVAYRVCKAAAQDRAK